MTDPDSGPHTNERYVQDVLCKAVQQSNTVTTWINILGDATTELFGEVSTLRAENERLRAENERLRDENEQFRRKFRDAFLLFREIWQRMS